MSMLPPYIPIIATGLTIATCTYAQDTLQTQSLDEVVISSVGSQGAKRSVKGQTASIDEHLSLLSHVNLVRRGSYAWEPVVNNMSTERISTTIDGMKIFYACTDKMDPVTSYVESSNLQYISLNSGLEGNPQSTGNIGGSIDLKLRKSGFDADAYHVGATSGLESNGWSQAYSADATYSSHRFYAGGGVFYRHANNYVAGGGGEIPFSQFQKVNVFTNLGVRLTERHVLEGAFIYDKAWNVGYPALNMDVAKAEGIISSICHKWNIASGTKCWDFLSLETKAYYNHITHIMDDTHRPDVEIHMDMPGRSSTSGLYSLLRAGKGCHDASLNYDLYYNCRFADMTMYPGGAAPMHMVTWADIGTLNNGLSLADHITLPHDQSIQASAKISWQQQTLNDKEGRDALRVFFPGMLNSYHQTTGRISSLYCWKPSDWTFSLGAGWGSRAATITEAYGYYLNNTFDQYDYIGNPHLKNESAVELNGALEWRPATSEDQHTLYLKLDANTFLFSNYIIGKFEERLSAMTVGAEGVKVYQNISHARIINVSFTTRWQMLSQLAWNASLAYAQGRDEVDDNLPLISPIAYTVGIELQTGKFGAHAMVKGNACQTNYGAKYGETKTPAFAIANIDLQYLLKLHSTDVIFRAGVENLFDKYYASYSDWSNIPQKGRNLFASIEINI